MIFRILEKYYLTEDDRTMYDAHLICRTNNISGVIFDKYFKDKGINIWDIENEGYYVTRSRAATKYEISCYHLSRVDEIFRSDEGNYMAKHFNEMIENGIEYMVY